MEGWLKVGTMALQEAKELERILKERGVEATLNHDSASCTRGCAVTVDVLVAEESRQAAGEVLRERFQGLAEGQVDWALLNHVYDPSAAEAVCPACGTRFATTSRECPDCGLAF